MFANKEFHFNWIEHPLEIEVDQAAMWNGERVPLTLWYDGLQSLITSDLAPFTREDGTVSYGGTLLAAKEIIDTVWNHVDLTRVPGKVQTIKEFRSVLNPWIQNLLDAPDEVSIFTFTVSFDDLEKVKHLLVDNHIDYVQG
jgi:hypothetical protein